MQPAGTGAPIHLKAGTWQEVRPQSTGWRFLSFRVFRIPTGERALLGHDREELAAVVLAGGAIVEGPAGSWRLAGRPSVFEGPSWGVYLPPGPG